MSSKFFFVCLFVCLFLLLFCFVLLFFLSFFLFLFFFCFALFSFFLSFILCCCCCCCCCASSSSSSSRVEKNNLASLHGAYGQGGVKPILLRTARSQCEWLASHPLRPECKHSSATTDGVATRIGVHLRDKELLVGEYCGSVNPAVSQAPSISLIPPTNQSTGKLINRTSKIKENEEISALSKVVDISPSRIIHLDKRGKQHNGRLTSRIYHITPRS